MIAIVEYGKGEPTINNIEISDNDVAGTYHGRGICVCGGRDIKVLRNKIDNILYDSGILLWADAGWYTNDVKRVLVEGNVITRIQTETAVYDPMAGTKWANKRRGFAAIRLAGNAADRLVTDNIIRNNTIDRTTVDGIALDGNVCKTTLEGNVTKNLGAGRVPIRDMRSATCPGGRSCRRDRLPHRAHGPLPLVPFRARDGLSGGALARRGISASADAASGEAAQERVRIALLGRALDQWNVRDEHDRADAEAQGAVVF